MGFLDSLSQWLRGRSGGPSDERESETAAPQQGAPARRMATLMTDKPAEIAPGVSCLLTVTDRRFVVEILDVTGESIRVSFPGIDYPVEGMLVDLEFHDPSGFSYYTARVIQGPQKEGDGILLEHPIQARRSQHRDSCRVPTDLEATVKDQVRPGSFPAKIQNLSTGGALLETEAEFHRDSTLEVTVKLPDEPEHTLALQVLYASQARETDGAKRFTYGTRFVGYEPGAGRSVTRYIWKRLKELYPAV